MIRLLWWQLISMRLPLPSGCMLPQPSFGLRLPAVPTTRQPGRCTDWRLPGRPAGPAHSCPAERTGRPPIGAPVHARHARRCTACVQQPMARDPQPDATRRAAPSHRHPTPVAGQWPAAHVCALCASRANPRIAHPKLPTPAQRCNQEALVTCCYLVYATMLRGAESRSFGAFLFLLPTTPHRSRRCGGCSPSS